jgi:hypothetical protein
MIAASPGIPQQWHRLFSVVRIHFEHHRGTRGSGRLDDLG